MYEYDSRVRFTEVGQDKKMTLMAVLNYFQDCSTFQSEDLGVGIEALEAKNLMWVLHSWQIVVKKYPKLGEWIRVGTSPYEFGKITGRRNFRMLDKQGELAACADSLWVLMDTKRMRPAKIEEELLRAYSLEPRLEMEYEKETIKIPEVLLSEASFAVQRNHLDVNHHVNNGQYVQLASQYLPELFEIHQMRAEYKKSAVLGNVIYPRVGQENNRYVVVLEDETGKAYTAVEFE